MDLREICVFLPLKGLSTRTIYNELTAALGADAIASLTVIKYLRQKQFMCILVDRLPEKPAATIIDRAILDAIEHYVFSSIRELACFTCIPIATVRRH
jgi:hypothetical protein